MNKHSFLSLLLGLIGVQLLIGQSNAMQEGHALFENKQLEESFFQFSKAKDSFLLARNDTAVAACLERMATIRLHQGNVNESLEFVEKGLSHARKSTYSTAYLRLMLFKAEYFKMKGDWETGKACWREIAPVFQPEGSLAVSAYRNFGSIYQFDPSDTADVLLQKGLDLAIATNQTKYLSGLYRHLSRRREIQSDLVGSIEYAVKGLKYVEDPNSSLAANFNLSLAESFYQLGDFKKALEYAASALLQLKDSRYKTLKHTANIVLAKICSSQSDKDCAEKNWTEAEIYFLEKKDNRSLLLIYSSRLNFYVKQKDPTAAAKYFELIKNYKDLLDDPVIENNINSNFTRYLYWIKDYAAAKKYLNAWSQSTTKVKNGFSKASLYLYTSLLAEQERKFSKSIEYLNKYKYYQDSIDQRKRSDVIYLLEAEYKQAEKEKEIQQLDGENQIQILALNQRNRLLSLGGLFLLIFGGFSITLFNKNKKFNTQKNQIQKNLQEKEILLDEIHSRVKNSLQTISSILSLQSRSMEDPNAIEAIIEGKNRVISMALIHENLYLKNNSTQINLPNYFNQLIDSLFSSYNISPGKIQLEKNFMEGFMNVDEVIPIGLILNELVSNALKHAFKGREKGILKVSFQKQQGDYQLSVTDNGVGINAQNSNKHSGFGSRIIQAFSKKLNATISRIEGNGTSIVVSFAPKKGNSPK